MAVEARNVHILVDPTTQPIVPAFDGAARLADLRNKRIGLIDDSKENAKELLDEIVDILYERYEISGVETHKKPSASKPADPEVIESLAASCDGVIVAIGS